MFDFNRIRGKYSFLEKTPQMDSDLFVCQYLVTNNQQFAKISFLMYQELFPEIKEKMKKNDASLVSHRKSLKTDFTRWAHSVLCPGAPGPPSGGQLTGQL